MSVINSALVTIANKDNESLSSVQKEKEALKATHISKAQIPSVRGVNRVAWAIGGATLSLCLGGWAVSQQSEIMWSELAQSQQNVESSVLSSHSLQVQEASQVIQGKLIASQKTSSIKSPTSKVVDNTDINLYTNIEARASLSEIAKVPTAESSSNAANNAVVSKHFGQENHPRVHTKTSVSPKVVDSSKEQNKSNVKADKQINLSNATAHVNHSKKEEPRERGTIAIERVELTPQQLANNAIERATKELDSNNLDNAIKEFEKALKYVPSDEETRKRLAALHYGKNSLRKSVELLQHGIRLNEDSQVLRIALSKILMKENQPEAALVPLIYFPDEASIEYLAMRAALAQRIKNSAIASETYRILVEKQSDNARWWLGLAIQQERELQYKEAQKSYQEAIGRVGVSKQTQVFIRDRLALLSDLLEDGSGVN